MQVVKNKNIPLILQLIKSDLTYEQDATVKYKIYNSDLSTIEVSETEISFNEDLNCYSGILDVSTNWSDQETGNYLLVWSISNTDLFASTMTEELNVVEDSNTEFTNIDNKLDTINTDLGIVDSKVNTISNKIDISDDKLDKILGLVHSNIYIDQPEYDEHGNLISARLRTYSNSNSVGTENDILGTYRISSGGDGFGKFTYWSQIEE